MYRVPLSKLNQLFAQISENMQLYLPSDSGEGYSEFTRWSEGVSLSRSLNTVKSAKDVFFPQVENLMSFRVSGKQIEISDEHENLTPFAVFGVRACDCRSFDVLDKVFLSEPVDTYYKSRRENGLIITLACNRPSETCFCGTFGIDPTAPCGDIACIMDDEYLYMQPETEKGSALTGKIMLLEECDESGAKAQAENIRKIMEKLPLHDIDTEGFCGENTERFFNSPKWKELSESCIGCGTCTFVCPTCQCYDIQEFTRGEKTRRFRCWDSCMYSDFTKMSAGQPRPTQMERFRQRFMHKLVYFPTNNDGMYSCVGCGRCLKKCPISMNIVKVMRKLREDEK